MTHLVEALEQDNVSIAGPLSTVVLPKRRRPAEALGVDGVLRDAVSLLERAHVPSPLVDAELLLGSVLGLNRGEVQVRAILGHELTPEQHRAFLDLVERRAAREPLQHLTGYAAFRSLTLAVGPGVFVPRPETESVAGLAIDALRATEAEHPLAVDLGTGSGAIALAMAAEVPTATVIGVENAPRAYIWARQNAAALALPNIRMIFTDLAEALPDHAATVDVLVSNPPYIPLGMIPRDPEVRLHDPDSALFGGPDGLDPMRAVVQTAARLLRAGGTLIVEHGELQGAAVRALLPAGDWTDAATHPDLTGRDRTTTALRR